MTPKTHVQISLGWDWRPLRGHTAHRLHPVHVALHLSLWSRALILSLKCRDVSCGTGSIKGPSVKQYFRENRQSSVVSSSPSHYSNTWRSVTVWCTSMMHSKPCVWTPRCMHIDFFHSQQYPTKGWPWASIDLSRIMFSQLYMIPMPFCLVLTVGIQTHRFTINVLLSGGWIVVAIETRSSDFSK